MFFGSVSQSIDTRGCCSQAWFKQAKQKACTRLLTVFISPHRSKAACTFDRSIRRYLIAEAEADEVVTILVPLVKAFLNTPKA